MAVVKITSQLIAKLNQPGSFLTPALLMAEFGKWRDKGETSHEMFAATTKTENYLRHTHIAPSDPVELTTWKSNHRSRKFGLLKSNNYLLWAFDPSYGNLLIDVLREPADDAHELWLPQNHGQLLEYQIVADNFQFDGTVP